MKIYLTIIFLGLIIIFGSYLRFANLSHNPNGLYVDEVSTGVNAQSILLTGKDEYGKSWPLAFRFLGSYTPPLYTYLTSAAIGVFGYSIITIRLVSAISGVIMLPLLFIFIKSLKISKGDFVPLLGSLLFAVTPWSVFYSRIGYEVNLAFLLYFLGVLFLWLSLRNKIFIIFAFTVLSLSLYSYQTQRFLSPLTIVIFLASYRKIIFKTQYRICLIIATSVFIIFLLSQLYLLITPAGLNRARGVFYIQFLNNPLFLLREFLAQYLSYFSPRNLFFQPDADLQRSLPELSVFYPWMIVPYLLGLFILLKEKADYKKFILTILLLTPISAALTSDPFATQRALPLLLPILLVTIIGINRLIQINMKLSGGIIFILIVSSLLSLYRSYAVLLPNERAVIWGYGFEQLANQIKNKPQERFIIDNGRIKPAYVELAFYLKIPPQIIQDSVSPNIKENYYQDVNWNGYYKLLNFETRAINWEKDIYQKQILVGDELSISDSQAKEHFLIKSFEIRSPTGEIIFKGFKTDPQAKLHSL